MKYSDDFMWRREGPRIMLIPKEQGDDFDVDFDYGLTEAELEEMLSELRRHKGHDKIKRLLEAGTNRGERK